MARHPGFIHSQETRDRISAGNAGKRLIDLSGMVFGRLSVIGLAASKGHGGKPRWVCKCECGRMVDIPGARLRGGGNRSCGCFRRDRCGGLYRSHGKSQTMQYCMFYDARKRSVSLGLPFSIIPDDISIPVSCPVLGIVLTEDGHRDSRPSLDRIIPSRGYTKENIKVISFRANRIKSNATADELRKIAAYADVA